MIYVMPSQTKAASPAEESLLRAQARRSGDLDEDARWDLLGANEKPVDVPVQALQDNAAAEKEQVRGPKSHSLFRDCEWQVGGLENGSGGVFRVLRSTYG